MTKIILHLGAHKTATTTLQKTLVNNQKLLSEQGILAPQLRGFRDNISVNLRSLRFHKAADWSLQRVLQNSYSDAEISSATRIILSDENIIGYSDHIFNKAGFYTDIGKRCRLFQKWLGQPPDTVLFTIRPYGDFFLSAYSQWIGLDNKFVSRAAAQKSVMALTRGWDDIVADLRAAFPQSKLVITQYQRRKEFSRAQLELVIGQALNGLVLDKKMFWNKGLTSEKLLSLEENLMAGSADQASVDLLRNQKIWGWPRKNNNFWPVLKSQELARKYTIARERIAVMKDVETRFGEF